MSEADMPLGFNRMNRFRQSLPLSRSASQSKLRSPGVLFLQFGDETRRVHITHELSSLETLHALIAHMFPQKLTASMLKSPNTAVLIKDEARNVFYELEDVRDIQDRSVIKIYRKEPVYGTYGAGTHLANGDLRREMVYTSRESSPTRRLNTLPSSTSSSSPARSRLSYAGSRPPSFSGQGHAHQQGSHHAHGPAHGPASALTASPSAILERRDVKPDEEVAGKGVVLLKAEGLYADPYGLMHESRHSVASTADPFGFPVPAGLYRRGSVRSLSTYSAAALQADLEEPLYKPGAGLYSDGYAPASALGVGFRLPPSSPQKGPDVQLRDRDSYGNTPSRSSPVRQNFRKDSASSSVFLESPKSRPGSSSEPLGGDVGRVTPGFGSALVGSEVDTSRDRMEAMEKQIASLTGLVQSVLTRAPDSDSTEKTESVSDGSATGSGRLKRKALTPSAPLALMPPPPAAPQPSNASKLHIQLHLQELKQNATDLRKQLSQLRKIQLQNQQSVLSLMKRTETELSLRVSDALRKQEDPLQRQRLLVEEERLKYLNEEELIIQQLHDLEKSVEEIQKESSLNHTHVRVQELEEKATVLRRLGETLTELKNQFPGLQSKMRVVLRVEVEAVKFLKEEPHRLDALLKRCKTITDTLTTLKRQVNEGIRKTQEDYISPSPKHTAAEDYKKSADFEIPSSPPLNLNESSLANWSPHSGHGHALSHSHPTSGQRERDLPGVVSLKGRGLEELGGRAGPDKTSSSVEVRLAAERDWEEKRASLTQYSAQDINRLLEETQAELMKAIPDLDFAAKQIKPPQNQNSSDVPSGTCSVPEHKPSKTQHGAHKSSSKEGGSRRSSDELTVARYRTEKPSKSPPPPPPRRSFPSSPGLTTRSGELIIPGKGMKKSESEEPDGQKPHVKLRRSVSEAPRPASTPPTVAAADREDGEDEKSVAEFRPLSRPFPPPSSLCEFTDARQFSSHGGLQDLSNSSPARTQAWHGPSSPSVPQIVLTECISVPVSPSGSSERVSPFGMEQTSSTVQKNDRNAGKNIATPSYFRHVVKIPSQAAWKQTPVPSPKRSPVPEKELQPRTKTSAGPLPGEKVVKRSRRMELRIQESFELEDEKDEATEDGTRQRPEDGGDTRASPGVAPLHPDLDLSSSTRGRGVGEESRDVKDATYRRLDSLEETIRELELSLMEFNPAPNTGPLSPVPAHAQSPSPGRSLFPGSFLTSSSSGAPSGASRKDPAKAGETQKPLVPPKPSFSADMAKTSGGKAMSRLKQLQQTGCEKTKLSKHRDDFLKSQGQQQ